MRKPSQLREDEAITITARGGAIGFHRTYGRLEVFAMNQNGNPREEGSGVLITEDEPTADKLYDEWVALLPQAEGVTITHINRMGQVTHTQTSGLHASDEPE